MSELEQHTMTVQQTVPLLLVSNIVKSKDFYCDGLGFELANKWEPEGTLAWCWLKQGGSVLMLQQACEEDPQPATWGKGITLYFICEEADDAYRALCDRNVHATQPVVTFYGMKQTFITDPDGYLLCFESETDRG